MPFEWPKTFYDSIKPFIYLNCHAGIGALRVPNQSDRGFFFMKLYVVAIIFAYCIAIYTGFNTDLTIPGSPESRIMYKVLISTNSAVTLIAPFLVWIQRKGWRNCLQQMPILDQTFQSNIGARNEYKKDFIRSTYRVIGVFLVMLVLGIHDFTRILSHVRSFSLVLSLVITLHHPILVMLVMDLNFCNCVQYLEKKFRDLNEALLRLRKPSNPEFPSLSGQRLFVISKNARAIKMSQFNRTKNTKIEEFDMQNGENDLLHEIRKAHLDLCRLSREINNVFGIQNLLSLTISFVMITGLVYTIYIDLIWNRMKFNSLREIIRSLMWTAIYAFKIIMVNHSCWSVSNEAQRTESVIYELLINPAKLEKEFLNNQIHEFSLQMLQNPVSFNACGFFTIDYTFVQGVIGSITTYLVILIQMSHLSDRNVVTSSNPFFNDTKI